MIRTGHALDQPSPVVTKAKIVHCIIDFKVGLRPKTYGRKLSKII
jgi:hypothetical protein